MSGQGISLSFQHKFLREISRPPQRARNDNRVGPAKGGHSPTHEMASHPNYVKKQLAIDTVSWTPINAPIDCMGVGIKNSVSADMKIRTDAADPTTQDLIPAGNQDGVMVSKAGSAEHVPGSQPARFKAGDTIAFLQAAAGTGPALITFVR